MLTRALLFSGITLLAALGCGQGRDESASRTADAIMAESEGAITSLLTRYVAAVEAGDTAAIAATFAEDIEVLFPTGPVRKGRADATAAFAEMFAGTTIQQLRRTDTKREIGTDLAVETGAYSITMLPKGAADGASITDTGYYVMVWKRQADGTWAIARGFNRSDAPATPLTAPASPPAS